MERAYLIAFEVNDKSTHTKVTDAIKLLGKWWNHLGNFWIVRTDTPAKTIKNYLNVFMGDKDKIIILGLDGEADWTGIDDPAGSWLTNFIIKIDNIGNSSP